MTAVVLVSSFSPVVALVGLAATLAAAGRVAHWGAFRPQVKRCVAASLLAFAFATVAVHAEELVYPEIDWCWQYTLHPDDWNEKPDKVDYDVALWLRLYKSKADEVECNIQEKHLKTEYGDLIESHLEKIRDMIKFTEKEDDDLDREDDY